MARPPGMKTISEMATDCGVTVPCSKMWVQSKLFILNDDDVKPSCPGATTYLGRYSQERFRTISALVHAGVKIRIASEIVFGSSDGNNICKLIKDARALSDSYKRCVLVFDNLTARSPGEPIPPPPVGQ